MSRRLALGKRSAVVVTTPAPCFVSLRLKSSGEPPRFGFNLSEWTQGGCTRRSGRVHPGLSDSPTCRVPVVQRF
ncbi:hypothetical protein ATANTOWER_003977 [Ataeniobius toweri]|uniref:Secreted protein n=1 Tax=Ataeniobius toweri TaxID=208326 RepID=A0ABU7CFE9_9TELE|nr:hypothetical protein [Ataeniobius toweri]